MPIYHCNSPEGLRDESQRENIAREIARIHCDVILPEPGQEQQWLEQTKLR
jgi:phenylpyruvate tautomerase PptA (4-oxalocrotonate tautomerase family)